MSTFGLDTSQKLSRARADLRMGAPVIVVGSSAVLFYAAEVLDNARFSDLRDFSSDVRMIVSTRRAETLKIACYDGAYAQISIPIDRDLWCI